MLVCGQVCLGAVNSSHFLLAWSWGWLFPEYQVGKTGVSDHGTDTMEFRTHVEFTPERHARVCVPGTHVLHAVLKI